jgi:two-component system NarL family response regulator
MNAFAVRRSIVLVMHADPLLRAGLVAALRQHSGFDVLVDGVDAVRADGPAIDVVIADYANAIRLADSALRVMDGPLSVARILALTTHDREVEIRRAFEAGVHGYLLLGGPLCELLEGVEAVASGVRFLCRAVAQRMADSLTHATLTSRETEVLQLMASGESNKGIARKLQIEVGTVKSHMSAIMTKLGASSRTQAAGIAATRGLVEERSSVQPLLFSSRSRLSSAQMRAA